MGYDKDAAITKGLDNHSIKWTGQKILQSYDQDFEA